MALCRCINHSPNIINYPYKVEPIGYPNTSSICGRNNCYEPVLIWLSELEHQNFINGIRIFDFASNVTSVKVK